MKKIFYIIITLTVSLNAVAGNIVDRDALAMSEQYASRADEYYRLAIESRRCYHNLKAAKKSAMGDATLCLQFSTRYRNMRLYEDAEKEMAEYHAVMEEVNECSRQMSRAAEYFNTCRENFIRNRCLSEKYRCIAYGRTFVPDYNYRCNLYLETYY